MSTAPTEVTSDGIRGVGAVDDDPDALERLWYLIAISGVVSMVIGILVLAYPDPSIKLLGVFMGIDLLIVGGDADRPWGLEQDRRPDCDRRRSGGHHRPHRGADRHPESR